MSSCLSSALAAALTSSTVRFFTAVVVVVVDEGDVEGAAGAVLEDELGCDGFAVSAAFAAGRGAGHADMECSFEPQLKHFPSDA